jgi:tetratricopeptide (TPR) repeat protein
LNFSEHGKEQERRMTLRFCLILSIFILTAPAWGQTEADKWFDEGMALFQAGNFSGSLQAYQKVLDIRPQDAEAWNNMGSDLGMLGRYNDALAAFDKATSLNERYAEAWCNMGLIFDLLGNYPAAIQAYNRATQINPYYEKALYFKNRDMDIVMQRPLSCNCRDQLPVI